MGGCQTDRAEDAAQKMQLARLPSRAWLSRIALIGFGSVCPVLVVLLMLTR